MLTDREVKEICQKQSEAYGMFLWFLKWFSYVCLFLLC